MGRHIGLLPDCLLYTSIIKTAVALQGHNVGKCRAPFNYVPEDGLEAIKKVLAENAAKRCV